MANLQAVSIGLYFPTQLRVVAGISRYLTLPPPQKGQSIRLLDPCCGKGSAALFLAGLLARASGRYQISPPDNLPTSDLATRAQALTGQLEFFGIELEQERAKLAARHFTHLLTTDSATARVQEGGFDLIWHNPPYDQLRSDEEGESRLEYAFLRRATRYLKPDGVLVHLIPQGRLEKAAEHLAHFYRDIRLFRFPYPEFGYFRQVVVLGVKRRGYTADQATIRYLKELSRGSPEALPSLPCPPAPQLEVLLSEVKLPLSAEDEKELAILRGATELEAVPATQAFTLTVPAGRASERILFRSGIYEPEAALAEAGQQGVWNNRGLLEEVAGLGERRLARPLLPMREGQLALLTAAGLLDNTVLEDRAGRPALVRGSLHKEWVLKEVKEDERGREISRTLREVLKLRLFLRDLVSGQKREIGPEEMGQFLEHYGENLRRRMLELYPPLYIPGKRGQGELPEKLEARLAGLKRKPLKAQRFAVVATALALLTGGCATLSAEQGSGKSFMGAAAAWLSGSRRVLVICPPHLVEKWVREVKSTIPGAGAEIIRNVTELKQALERIKQHEIFQEQRQRQIASVPPYFLIISREAMKLSHQWEAAVTFRLYRDDEGRVTYAPHCPRCGAPVLEKGEPVPLSRLKSKKYSCRSPVKSWRWQEEKQRQVPDIRSCGERLWQAVASPLGEQSFSNATCTLFQPDPGQTHRWYGGEGYVRPAELLRQRLNVPPEPVRPSARGPRRLSLSRYIARFLPGYFDLLIGDEIQEYKANGSAQGISLGRLSEVCARTLVMTGTFAGGYASNLFWLLMRFSRQIRQEYGFSSAEEWRFIDHYGVIEKTIFGGGEGVDIALEDGALSDRRGYARVQLTEKPGLSPAVLTLMMGHTVFLQLADVATDLPPYREHVITVAAEGEIGEEGSQYEKYRYLEETLRKGLLDALQEGSSRLLGVMVNTLLWWVDQPFKPEVALDPRYKERIPKEELGKLTPTSPCLTALPPGAVLAALPEGDAQKLYPKEQELQRLYLREKAEGRRLLVFVSNTRGRDIMPRVAGVLEQVGAKVALLRSEGVEAGKREQWIEARLKEGIDVLVAQPVSVQTGLDLLAFPTITFYQLHPSTFVVRQAARRSWRIGQSEPVHVYFFAYAGTAQEGLLRLMAKKVQASRMLEGNLEGDGLVGLADEDEGGSLVMALARQIAGQGNAGSEMAVSLEELLERLHAADLESARFLLEEEAGEEVVEEAVQAVYRVVAGGEVEPEQSGSAGIAGLLPEPGDERRLPAPVTGSIGETRRSKPTLEELRQQLLAIRRKKIPAEKQGANGIVPERGFRQLTLLELLEKENSNNFGNDTGKEDQNGQLSLF